MATQQQHKEAPTLAAGRRQDDAQSEAQRRPLLNLPLDHVVLPPLHLLQGLINKMLELMAPETRRRLLERANVAASYRLGGLLTGRRYEELLAFIERWPNSVADPHTLSVFRCLQHVSCWARARGADVSNMGIARLRKTLAKLSASWRAADLPTTPKLHVVEAHLASAIQLHHKWGAIGEQGVEAIHKLGVDADNRCFGANDNGGLAFFVRRHFALSLADTRRFNAPRKKTPPTAPIDDATRELHLFSLAQL